MAEEVRPLKESPQPFHLFLARVESGTLHADLTDQLVELNGKLATLAAQNGKAKGSITVKFDIVHQRNGVVEVTADFKVAEPKTPRESSIFFVTEGSNLSTENPRQPNLPLRSVEQREERPREVPGEQPARQV